MIKSSIPQDLFTQNSGHPPTKSVKTWIHENENKYPIPALQLLNTPEIPGPVDKDPRILPPPAETENSEESATQTQESKNVISATIPQPLDIPEAPNTPTSIVDPQINEQQSQSAEASSEEESSASSVCEPIFAPLPPVLDYVSPMKKVSSRLGWTIGDENKTLRTHVYDRMIKLTKQISKENYRVRTLINACNYLNQQLSIENTSLDQVLKDPEVYNEWKKSNFLTFVMYTHFSLESQALTDENQKSYYNQKIEDLSLTLNTNKLKDRFDEINTFFQVKPNYSLDNKSKEVSAHFIEGVAQLTSNVYDLLIKNLHWTVGEENKHLRALVRGTVQKFINSADNFEITLNTCRYLQHELAKLHSSINLLSMDQKALLEWMHSPFLTSVLYLYIALKDNVNKEDWESFIKTNPTLPLIEADLEARGLHYGLMQIKDKLTSQPDLTIDAILSPPSEELVIAIRHVIENPPVAKQPEVKTVVETLLSPVQAVETTQNTIPVPPAPPTNFAPPPPPPAPKFPLAAPKVQPTINQAGLANSISTPGTVILKPVAASDKSQRPSSNSADALLAQIQKSGLNSLNKTGVTDENRKSIQETSREAKPVEDNSTAAILSRRIALGEDEKPDTRTQAEIDEENAYWA